jgi:hypothetical protein
MRNIKSNGLTAAFVVASTGTITEHQPHSGVNELCELNRDVTTYREEMYDWDISLFFRTKTTNARVTRLASVLQECMLRRREDVESQS